MLSEDCLLICDMQLQKSWCFPSYDATENQTSYNPSDTSMSEQCTL